MATVISAAIAGLLVAAAPAAAQGNRIFVGNPGTANAISGTTAPTGTNPYGLVVVPKDLPGGLRAGDLCSSNWNDANGRAGQGNNINCFRRSGNGLTKVASKTISPTGRCQNNLANLPPGQSAGTGIGLTMGFSYIGSGYFLQTSLPIPVPSNNATATNADGNTFKPAPGCAMVLNSNFDVVATASGNGINGVWGSVCDVDNDDKDVTTTCWLSNVLGPNGNVLGQNNGLVNKYVFKPPSDDRSWKSGDNDDNFLGRPTTVANGFVSMPNGIAGGTVAPSGIASSMDGSKRIFIAGTLDGANQQGIIYTVPKGGQGRNPFVSCPASGGCLKPIGVNIVAGQLGVANGGDGNLVAYRQDNGQFIEKLLVDPAGAGVLFNVIQLVDRAAYNDDGQNVVSALNPFGGAPTPGATATATAVAVASASGRRMLM